jgi:O-antigen ligase
MNFTWLILGGGALVLFGLFKWRWAVFGALLLVVFEGAIRKWVLPQASSVIYFAKDFLLLGAYVSYFTGENRKHFYRFGEGMNWLLLAAVTVTFLESFNSDTGSLVAGLFGWKAYVMYMPLCFMVPAMFRTPEEAERFLHYYLALALPVCLLGVAQFAAPADSPLNVYAPGAAGALAQESDIATFGEDAYVRITGTFSYISGFGTYLVVVLALMVPVLAWARTRLWAALFSVTLALVIGNVMMTGSRATALGAGLVLGGTAFFTSVTGQAVERKRAWVHWLAGAVALVAAFHFFEDALTAMKERTTGEWEEGKIRFFGAVIEPWHFLGAAGLLGHGTGISQPAVNALRTTLQLPPPVFEYSSPTDAENSRVLMELGIPGFLVWYGLRLGLLVGLWQTWRKLRSPFLRQLALAGSMVLFYQFFTATMFAHTANIYHWFIAGFIFLLPKLDAQTIPQPVEAGPERPAYGARRRRARVRWRRRKPAPTRPTAAASDGAPAKSVS